MKPFPTTVFLAIILLLLVSPQNVVSLSSDEPERPKKGEKSTQRRRAETQDDECLENDVVIVGDCNTNISADKVHVVIPSDLHCPSLKQGEAALTISGKDVTVDCTDHIISSKDKEGIGFRVAATGVKINNCIFESFRVGIFVRRNAEVTIDKCKARGNRSGFEGPGTAHMKSWSEAA